MVGVKGSKPDFVITEWDAPIEVEYVRESRPLKEIQEEISTDVAMPRVRIWRRLLLAWPPQARAID